MKGMKCMRFDKFFKFPLFFIPWVLLLLVMLAELYTAHYLWAHHIRIWGMSFGITFFLFCFPGLSALYITKRIVLYYGDKLLIKLTPLTYRRDNLFDLIKTLKTGNTDYIKGLIIDIFITTFNMICISFLPCGFLYMTFILYDFLARYWGLPTGLFL